LAYAFYLLSGKSAPSRAGFVLYYGLRRNKMIRCQTIDAICFPPAPLTYEAHHCSGRHWGAQLALHDWSAVIVSWLREIEYQGDGQSTHNASAASVSEWW